MTSKDSDQTKPTRPATPETAQKISGQKTVSSSGERLHGERQDDRLSVMGKQILSSLGRLPTGLVMIFAISLSITAIMGLMMKYSTKAYKEKKEEIVRLDPAPQIQIDPNSLQGVWAAHSGQYVMSVSFKETHYEWMIEHVKSPNNRFFSRGDWGIKGDVLVLMQREDLGYPYDTEKPYIRFLPIRIDNLNIKISEPEKTMSWQIPFSEYKNMSSFGLQLFESGTQETQIFWRKN